MNKNHYILIMAGGIGTRFWPISRKSFPKQFMDILGTGKSLITQTYERFTQVVPEENIYIVANGEYTSLIKEHIPSITGEQILKEPLGKNTAPCIAYASYYLKQKNPNAVCMVAPSDHLITNEFQFKETALQALEFANQEDALVTLGIQPSRPDTGYGYIQFMESDKDIKEVKTFTEKPTAEIAQTFIESKEFLWNAGIFAWSITSICQRFESKLPDIHQLFSEIDYSSHKAADKIEKAYGQCPSISIDYGIMEKDDNVYVIPSDFGWSDLGTWKSLWDVSEKDEQNNSLIGDQTLSFDSKDNLVFSKPEKLVVISGVKNLVVVDSEEVLLVMNKDKEQEIKGIVNDVKNTFKGKYN